MTSPRFDLEALSRIPDPLGDRAALAGRPIDALPPAGLGRSRTRGEARRDVRRAIVATIVAQAVTVLAVRPRPFDAAVVVAGVILPALAAVVGGLVARRAPSRKVAERFAAGILLPWATFLVTAFLTRSLAPVDLAREVHATIVCVALAAAFTLAPLAALGFAYRRSFASASVSRGAALGVAVGLVGAVTLRLHCPNDGLVHVVVSHGAALVFGAVAGVILGRRRLRA